MMQGDNENIKVILGITLFTDYLAIYMIYHCGVVFCLYNVMALYNTLAPQPGGKWQHSSDQDMPDPGQEEEAPYNLPEELPMRSRNL